jgi:hypothetical protein
MIAVLLSHERSGSHLVGEYMASLGFRMLDEVCNPNAVNPFTEARSWLRYRADWTEANRAIALKPGYRDHMGFLQGYFAHLQQGIDRPVGVDIKYGHIHNFESFWKPVFQRPVLFEALEAFEIPLVHLHRRNVVETAVSAEIAEQRRVWHSWQQKDPAEAERRFTLPVARIVSEALLYRQQADWIAGHWMGGARVFDLIYEEVVAGLDGATDVLDRLAAFLGAQRNPAWAPRLQKLGRPLDRQVENYAELKAACAAAGLGEHLPA